MNANVKPAFRKRDGVYQWCNQSFAFLAGESSSYTVVGKNDEGLIWRGTGNDCLASDAIAMKNIGIPIPLEEWIRTSEGWKKVIADKVCDDGLTIDCVLREIPSIEANMLDHYDKHGSIYCPCIQNFLTRHDMLTILYLIRDYDLKTISGLMGKHVKSVDYNAQRLLRLYGAEDKNNLLVQMGRVGITTVVEIMERHRFS